jgi:DNA-directed RNA polymerase subunit RPC12/RpoP
MEHGTITSTRPVRAIRINSLCPECGEEIVNYIPTDEEFDEVQIRCPDCELPYTVDLMDYRFNQNR